MVESFSFCCETMLVITRKFEFDAGHRVWGHESKCANLHGHRYVAEVTVEAPHLDAVGRIIDFSKLKQVIGDWIDHHWDHNILLHSEDPLTKLWRSSEQNQVYERSLAFTIFNGKTPFIMPEGTNPTAENMAEFLLLTSISLMEGADYNVQVVSVKLYETPNCWSLATIFSMPSRTASRQ